MAALAALKQSNSCQKSNCACTEPNTRKRDDLTNFSYAMADILMCLIVSKNRANVYDYDYLRNFAGRRIVCNL
jgi:hypothetical protein